MFLGFGLSFIK